MCEPPVLRCTTNLRDSFSGDLSSGKMNNFFDKFKASRSLKVKNRGEENRRLSSKDGNMLKNSYRLQLEEDVQKLQLLLNEEKEMHAVLESALEHAAVTLSDLSCLPKDARELLSSIATLELSVTKLEEDIISLHLQLIQERNERRLAEYHMKKLPSKPLQIYSADNGRSQRSLLMQAEVISDEVLQQISSGRIEKKIPQCGLWNHPNKLSEEILYCMKNIFISLADAARVTSKPSSTVDIHFPISPMGHISSSPIFLVSELSRISSWVHSPRVSLCSNNEILATGTTIDPYKVRGKLCWSDIGNYSLATEVSWMSVEKKQLEYAAGALRKFRSLIEQLAEVNPGPLNNNEKLAFWINLYNALIMHAYLAYGVPRSETKLFALMQKAAYTVGGHSLSAACIEYGILKMKPPVHRPQTALLLAIQKLKISDEQKNFSLETSEPLAAFALSCGSYSSPAVKIYTPTNVKEELQEAQRDFIRASVGVSNKGRLLIPKMLHNFVRGLADDANIPIWICGYLPQQQAVFVEQCMSQRRQSFLGSRNFGILPFDSRFRYLFMPDKLP